MFKDVERNYNLEFTENLGQKFYFAKLAADYSKEMRRSVKVAIKDWIKKNNDF